MKFRQTYTSPSRGTRPVGAGVNPRLGAAHLGSRLTFTSPSRETRSVGAGVNPRLGAAHLGSRLTFAAVACLALALPSCKDDIKPDAHASASANASSSSSLANTSSAPRSSSSVVSLALSSVPAAPTTFDANGIPQNASGVLADGVADGILKPGAPPVIKLLAPGEEPREAITYELSENKKQTSGMKMNLDMTMAVGDKAMPPTTLPQIGMNIELATGKKEASGDFNITGTVTKVAIKADDPSQDQLAKAIEPTMGTLKGLTIKYQVSPKGRAHDVQVNAPANADAKASQMLEQMKQSFDSMVAPLPDEPVGIGASWVVITRLKTGADILQYTTYTLKSRAGKKVVFDTQVKQFAASASLSAPGGGPAGTIIKFISGGTGSASLDLASLGPDKGNNDVSGSMAIGGGPMGTMTVETKVRIGFGPAIP